MELPQTLNPIFDKVGEKALLRPWQPEKLLEGQLDPQELIEENLRLSCLKNLQGKSGYGANSSLKHLEVNGRPGNAEIRLIVDISYNLQSQRFLPHYQKNSHHGGKPQWIRDTQYCEKHFEVKI